MRRSPVHRRIWGARGRASRLWHHDGGSSLVEWAALSACIAALMVAVTIALRAQGTAVGTSIGQVIQCHITAAGSGGSCGNVQIGRSIPGVALANMSDARTTAVGLPLALAALPIAPSAAFLLGIAGLLVAGGLPISMIALSNAMNGHTMRKAGTVLAAGRVGTAAVMPQVAISFNRSYLSSSFAMQTQGVDQTVQGAQSELLQLEADVTGYLNDPDLSAEQKRQAIIDSIQTRLTTVKSYLDTLALETAQPDGQDAAAGMMLINMEVVNTLGRIIAAVDGQTGSDGAPVADRNNAADSFYTDLREQYQTIINPQQDIYYIFAPADHPAIYMGGNSPDGYPNTPFSQIAQSLLAQNVSPGQLLYFGASNSTLHGFNAQWSDELVVFVPL